MPRSTRSTRSARPATTKAKYKLDIMSITILLVMAIFGGVIGYYIGMSAGANQMLDSLQTTQMMQGGQQPVPQGQQMMRGR